MLPQNNIISPKKILVAMSGGVDSALTAALLCEAGHEVSGITLDLFAHQAPTVVQDARAICDHLGISHRVLKIHDEFSQYVAQPFIRAYAQGLTPNPCMICNQHIKFGILLDYALSNGYDQLATGHYAQIQAPSPENPHYRLKRGLADRKDQAYFLHRIPSRYLKHVCFPLGVYANKDIIRNMASERHLPVATKKDSEGICFADGMDYRPYIMAHLEGDASGEIRTLDGTFLSKHPGYFHYTVGQKRQLPIKLEPNTCVTAIDPVTKTVWVGPESAVYAQELAIDKVNWLEPLEEGRIYEVKLFNWGYTLKASLKSMGDASYAVTFTEPVRAIAPGQYLVVYDGDYVLGGGEVVKILP